MSSLNSTFKPLTNLLHRYHFVVFVVVAIGGVAVTFYLLYTVFMSSFPGDNQADASSSTFDAATIDRINKRKTPNEPATPPDLSGRRLNPFTEG